MGKLIYKMNVSLDGFIETPAHSLEWFNPDEELLTWFNDQERKIDAFLYGRKLYETMAAYWPTAESDPNATDYMLEYSRIWNDKPKIVFSSTLPAVDWNSHLVNGDIGDILVQLQTEFGGDLIVGGPTLASSFIQRRLVDEFQLLIHPVILGAGTPYFPPLETPMKLRKIDYKEFDSGVTLLTYELD